MRFLPSDVAIQRPSSIYILIILITLMGFSAYRALPREAAPDIQIPLLIVSVPYPGSSPQDVEALIINKVEKEFKGLENLKKISSTSTEGAGVITLEFELGFDIDEARSKVREALDRVKPELPKEAEDPLIQEINLSEEPILIITLSGKLGLVKLKDIAEDLKDEIEGIPGVLEAQITGGLEREVQVDVDPNKLNYYNISLEQVSNAINRENTSVPAGEIQLGALKYAIRVPGEISEARELEDMVAAAPNQVPIFVRDLAKVTFGFQEVVSRSRLNQSEAVSLSVSKRSGENLIAIADQIKEVVKKEEARWGGKLSITLLTDESKRIRQLVSDLENNIYTGIIFVVAVLLFAMGARNAFFIGMAIPLSMLISFLIISWMGITLNFVVLFSLILALGMLVDNAIVVVENIYRHLESGLSPAEAAKVGVGEVAIPVISSTLTTLAAFMPLLFMPGIAGEFMSYLPVTLIITLSASLFVGLILNPVLCATLMQTPKNPVVKDEIQMAQNSRFLRLYQANLNWALDNRWKVIGLVTFAWFALLFGYGKFVLPKAGVEFFPTTEPQSATIHVELPFGTNLDASDQLVAKIEEKLKPYFQYTDAVVANVGTKQGSRGQSSKTTHLSHLTLSFPDWSERKELPSKIITEVRQLIRDLPGAKVTITKPAGGPPTGKPVNIEVKGEDLNLLKELSTQIQAQIKGTPGLVNLGDDFSASRSEIQIKLDREKIARHGLSTAQVAGNVRTAFNGRTVSTYRINKDEYDIVVRLAAQYRQNLGDIRDLYVQSPTGQNIALSELAAIEMGPALGSIRHIGGKMVITVSGDAEGIPGATILKQAQTKLEGFKLPPGYSITYSGESEERDRMQAYLQKSFVVAIFLIGLVLVTQFNSLVLPLIILSSVFLSFMGIFLGMIIHQAPVSIMMGGIGAISLAGVVVNNAIVLIDYIQQLRREGMEKRRAVVLAGMLRMRPVLLTAATTVLGLVPITMGMDINFYHSPIVVFGAESGAMWVPMARSVIYGLAVATGLTLIVVPVIYSLIESGRDKANQIKDRLLGRLAGSLQSLKKIKTRKAAKSLQAPSKSA